MRVPSALWFCAFIKGRLEQMARDEKIDADTVAAVSAGSVSAPVDYFALAHALKDARDSDADTFDNLATAYARASHLADADLASMSMLRFLRCRARAVAGI